MLAVVAAGNLVVVVVAAAGVQRPVKNEAMTDSPSPLAEGVLEALVAPVCSRKRIAACAMRGIGRMHLAVDARVVAAEPVPAAVVLEALAGAAV